VSPPQQLGSNWSGQPRGYLPQQHSDQWTWQLQQQRQHSLMEPQQLWAVQQQQQPPPAVHGARGAHVQRWQAGAMYAQPEDDEVSDILNF
jgi:hypothetical protein